MMTANDIHISNYYSSLAIFSLTFKNLLLVQFYLNLNILSWYVANIIKTLKGLKTLNRREFSIIFPDGIPRANKIIENISKRLMLIINH